MRNVLPTGARLGLYSEVMIRLGSKVRDKVTGITGIAITESRFLTGCLRYSIQPPMDKDGKRPSIESGDEHHLDVLELPEETGIMPTGSSLEIEAIMLAAAPIKAAPGGPQDIVSQRNE